MKKWIIVGIVAVLLSVSVARANILSDAFNLLFVNKIDFRNITADYIVGGTYSGAVAASTITTTGNVNVGGGYSSGGITLFSSGSGWFDGDILLSGELLTVNTIRVNGSHIPIVDNSFTLGNSSHRWRDAYISRWVNTTYLNVSAGLVVTPSGNVGIGTTNPQRTLHVIGETWFRGGGGDIQQWYNSAGTRVAQIQNDGTTIIGSSAEPKNMLDIAGNVAIGSYAGVNTGPSNGLIVSGNVGIGTAAPTKILHVRHTTHNGITTERANATVWSGHTFLTNGVEEWFMGMQPNSDTLLFRANGNTNHMAITDAGNVGIGTTTPASKLHIGGVNNYLQLSVNTTVLQTTDCDSESERGRMIVDNSTTAKIVHICFGSLGWGYMIFN